MNRYVNEDMAWDGYCGLAALACVVKPRRCGDACLFRCIQFRSFLFERMDGEPVEFPCLIANQDC